MQNAVRLFAAASIIVLLAGCGSGGSDGDAFTEFQAKAIAAAGLPEEHEPEETAVAQLGRAEDALEDGISAWYSGVRVEHPGGDGATTRPQYLDSNDPTVFRLGFTVEGETLEWEVSAEDLFGPSDDLDSRAVLTKNGVTLVRRSPGEDSEDRPLTHSLYGAWMEHAGFIVAVDGDFIVSDGAGGRFPIPGRFAAGGGDRKESPPAADATWKGLMIGTIESGADRDDILQGDAELTFELSSSTVDATFSKIRNLDKDAAHPGGPIEFADMQVNSIGDYRNNEDDSFFWGRFYGGGHAETAGAFSRNNVRGAYGAKEVTN
ncbi:MAG: hypothetical protein GDA41_12355 [Rhodospirillales bacterium]|nr:hypothetical protein [Rhodospirillales bacterium]